MKAFKEISEIIKFFPKHQYNKIPKSFIDFIEENIDRNYEYIVSHIDDFQNQQMLNETRIILSIIYRDFIASSEGREQIYKTEKLELLQEDEKTREKYSLDFLKSKEIKEKIVDNSTTVITEGKESIFTKIKNWFRYVFNK